jgi:hypothetical protein
MSSLLFLSFFTSIFLSETSREKGKEREEKEEARTGFIVDQGGSVVGCEAGRQKDAKDGILARLLLRLDFQAIATHIFTHQIIYLFVFRPYLFTQTHHTYIHIP